MDRNQEEDLSNCFNLLKLDKVPVGMIASTKLTLLEFTLFVESQYANKDPHVVLHFSQSACNVAAPSEMETLDISLISDKLPSTPHALESFFLVKFWADFNFREEEFPLFFFTTRFQSGSEIRLGVKTEICMFGRSIGEKIEEGWKMEPSNMSNDQFIYGIVRSQLCSYFVNFIRKLRADCSGTETMNGVLENFSVMQVVTNQDTQEVLLSMAYVFEVCSPESSASTGAMCSVYRLSGVSSS